LQKYILEDVKKEKMELLEVQKQVELEERKKLQELDARATKDSIE
jgi:hypothetical protein